MGKWDLINILRDMFSAEEIADMFVYWLDINSLEECIKDFLNDRDLEIRNGYIKTKEMEWER